MMEFEYYYGNEPEQFKFLMVPKKLFDETFSDLSVDAKLLYSFLFERVKLSYQNKWIDKNNRVYIYFTLNETEKVMNCGHDKATKLFKELETIGLIVRERQGLGLPTKIFVKKFIAMQNAKKSHNGLRENSNPECENNSTKDNKLNNTNVDMIDWQSLKNVVKSNISYDEIISEYSGNITIQSQIDEIVGLIVDVVSGYRAIKIDGNIIPNVIAKERYLLLRYEHIKYVIESMANLKTDVKRIDNYVCTALYNATLTCNIADLKGFTAKTGVPLV